MQALSINMDNVSSCYRCKVVLCNSDGNIIVKKSILFMNNFRLYQKKERYKTMFSEANMDVPTPEVTSEVQQAESKSDKFIRIAEQRVNKALAAIEKVSGLSNTSTYEYTQEQVNTMFKVLEIALEEAKKAYQPKIKTFSFGNVEKLEENAE